MHIYITSTTATKILFLTDVKVALGKWTIRNVYNRAQAPDEEGGKYQQAVKRWMTW